MSRTKELKSGVVTILNDSPDIDNKINILSAILPESTEQKEEIYKSAQNTDASIYVTYSGRVYKELTGGYYQTYESVTIYIFSKVLNDNDSNPLDIEVLLDKITDVLSQKGYTLFEDGLRPVKDKKTGLYEAVLIIGKTNNYSSES